LQAITWTDVSRRPPESFVGSGSYDGEECLEWFRDVPRDTISWRVNNSARQDITIAGDNRFRRARSVTVLPVSERHVMRWNGDPYTLDGGEDGRVRDDGTPLLLPYWLGRYHRLIE
jgi:hypothetical protein